MSNYLAIATVTETLRWLLQASADGEVPGTTVTATGPGDQSAQPSASRIDVFLYGVAPSARMRNIAPPARGEDLALEPGSQVALDLDYLISVSGDATQLEPQRLLGIVVRTLNSHPILDPQVIGDALGHTTLGFLADSDLSDQVGLVQLTPAALGLGELAMVWSGLIRAPFLPSVAYRAGVVLIDGG